MVTTYQDPPPSPTAQEQLNDWRWAARHLQEDLLCFSLLSSALPCICARGAAAWKTSRRLTGAPVCIGAPGKYPGRLLTLKLQAP